MTTKCMWPWRPSIAAIGALFISTVAVTSWSSAEEGGQFILVAVDNPQYCGNEMFRAFENYYSPRIRQLRSRYHLDAVVVGEADEWKRILLLRHWIRSNTAIDNDNPTPTRGDTFAILDAALKGGKFHCTHFSIVQHAVLNSFGYVTRRLGCGPGLLGMQEVEGSNPLGSIGKFRVSCEKGSDLFGHLRTQVGCHWGCIRHGQGGHKEDARIQRLGKR